VTSRLRAGSGRRLLAAAAHRPQVDLYGEAAYPDLDTKAAVLLESVVRNHALVDGNKRLGWLATVVFYGLNHVTLDAPDDDAYQLVMAVARSEPTVEGMAAALKAWH
jgi:death on curing protein